jgi:hypothetical protein
MALILLPPHLTRRHKKTTCPSHKTTPGQKMSTCWPWTSSICTSSADQSVHFSCQRLEWRFVTPARTGASLRFCYVFVPSPSCPLNAPKVAGLLATVLLLLFILFKPRIQSRVASALGLFLLASQTFVCLAATGDQDRAAIAARAFALHHRQTQAACRR